MTCTLLGTGSSAGVPRVGGDWGLCDPSEPRNQRSRCSALIEKVYGEAVRTTVLIDTSPDLRGQLLRTEAKSLDAIVYTHDHADQTHGIDDVRAFAIRRRAQIPVYMNAETWDTLGKRFNYCFEGKGGYPPILAAQPLITAFEPFQVDGPAGPIPFLPVPMEHGRIECYGFRIGDFAYCNDVSAFPRRSMDALRGLDTLVIDALQRAPHPTHAHLGKALEWIAELKPRLAVLTNMHIDMDYQTLRGELPDGVVPGYDGMVLEFGA